MTLPRRNRGKVEELAFDSETGELQAAGNAEARDRLPATRIVREGFFAAVNG